MFKKIMAYCVIGTFSICTLHAQNQNDTVPSKITPRIDSVPRTDTTTRMDTTKTMAIVISRNNLKSLSAPVRDTVPSDTTKTDTTKAMAFVMNHENLTSLNAQVRDTVPSDTTKKDTTNTTAFVSNNQKVKNIFRNNAEQKEHLKLYAIKSKVE